MRCSAHFRRCIKDFGKLMPGHEGVLDRFVCCSISVCGVQRFLIAAIFERILEKFLTRGNEVSPF